MTDRTRREFLAGAVGLLASTRLAAGPLWNQEPYDVVVAGGTLVDPGQGISGPRDIGIRRGRIAEVAPSIPRDRARRVIEARNLLVTPGLIDIHVHVYPGVPGLGIDPDLVGISRGVTTVVDAGSAGATNFAGFRDHVARPARTRVYALLNMSRVGMTAPNELALLDYVDVVRVVETIQANRDVLVGIKVRMLDGIEGGQDLEVMRRTREAADRADVPITLHIGGQRSPLPRVISHLRPGDVITHAFRRAGSILAEDGRVYPEVLDAVERGVRLDIGHGMGNLDFDVAERILDQGVRPHVISSDVHDGNVVGPVFDLPTNMSKFMALGLSVEEAVRASTITPAGLFDFGHELGTLAVGAPADVSAFEMVEGDYEFIDASGKRRAGHRRLTPVFALRDGNPYGVARG